MSLGGKPHYSVSDAFSTCLRNVDVLLPIMVKGGAKVPGVDGVGGPCAPDGGFFVHKYFVSRGRHCSGIEVVESIEEGVSGKFWVEARGAEEIQCDDRLRKEAVPLV